MKIGLALGGGGAKGAYQVGALKAFEEYNLLDQIDVISGVSIGAINTVLLMNYNNVGKMVEMWHNLTNSNVFSSFNFFSRSLFNLKPLFKIVTKDIDINTLKTSKYDGYVTSARLLSEDFRYINLRSSNIVLDVFHINSFYKPLTATLASASIPVVFNPVILNDHYYVDGGLINRYPIDVLIDKGCNVIINIPLDNFLKLKDFDLDNKLFIDLGAEIIFPKTKTFDLLQAVNFDLDKQIKKYKYGYILTKRMIKTLIEDGIIVGNKFVFKDEKYFIDKEFEKRLHKRLGR